MGRPLGAPRKTGLAGPLRDERLEHDGEAPAAAPLTVCFRCLRHRIAGPKGAFCRTCTTAEEARAAAEALATGQLCACGCGVRFAPIGTKTFASPACRERAMQRRRDARRGSAR